MATPCEKRVKHHFVVLVAEKKVTRMCVYEVERDVTSAPGTPLTTIGGTCAYGDIFEDQKLEKVQPVIDVLLMEAYEIIQGARGKHGFGTSAVSVYCVHQSDVPSDTQRAVHISGFNEGYRFHVAGEPVKEPVKVLLSEAVEEHARGPVKRKVHWESLGAAKQGMLDEARRQETRGY